MNKERKDRRRGEEERKGENKGAPLRVSYVLWLGSEVKTNIIHV